jgi:hypothetical protein
MIFLVALTCMSAIDDPYRFAGSPSVGLDDAFLPSLDATANAVP